MIPLRSGTADTPTTTDPPPSSEAVSGSWSSLAGLAALCVTVAAATIAVRWATKSGALLVVTAAAVVAAAGLVLAVRAATTWWRRHQRWQRIAVVPVTVVAVLVAVAVISPAIVAAVVPPTRLDPRTPADVGLEHRDVEMRTADGVTLSGWYVPSRNGAAVVLRHGAGTTRTSALDHAAVLARHGYGVLLADARGHGRSAGRGMDLGWWGDLDTSAGIDLLVDRGIDADRIAAVGLSMGGEEAIGAAAADPRLRVVVAEGATARTPADTRWYPDAYGAVGWLAVALDHASSALTELLTPAPRPVGLRDAVASAGSTRFLLIAAGALPEETHAAEHVAAAAPERTEVWTVPGAGHTGALRADPDGWERRVIGLLDDALLEEPRRSTSGPTTLADTTRDTRRSTR